MGHRKKTSTLEELIYMAALIPWWISIILGIASYLYLSWLADNPLNTTYIQGNIGPLMKAQFVNTLATFGQFLIPGVFLFGAIAAFFRRKKREKLVSRVRTNHRPDPFNSVSWHDFELLVGQYYKENGYKVVETGGVADGGIDLRLKKEGETYLVQCKHWKTGKVPVAVVRELYGAMAAEGAAGAFVVTSGRFTADAEAFARGKNIELVDGRLLTTEIRQAPTQPAGATPADQAATPHSDTACPLCQSEMVHRVAKKGPAAGTTFYGCSRFPKCRGMRST